MKITPALDTLPVYARGGAVVPMQPLVQSTLEMPKGPLTLRIYPGPADATGRTCTGELYLDDCISYNFQRGAFLRMRTECRAAASGMTIHVGSHEGSYKPWWHQVALEVYGWKNAEMPSAKLGTVTLPVTKNTTKNAWEILLPDIGKGVTVELR